MEQFQSVLNAYLHSVSVCVCLGRGRGRGGYKKGQSLCNFISTDKAQQNLIGGKVKDKV